MGITPRDTLSEAFKGAKLIKDMLQDLYQTSIKEDGENYNKSVALAYGSSVKLLMDIEQAQNSQVNIKSKKQKK